MIEPPIPDDEAERLRALRLLKVLNTPSEERFDRLTRIAKALFEVPIALVSLVDGDRQWFKSRQGLEACETPRGVSFCGHAILGREILHVPNTLDDRRFADNPLVTGAPNIRFYAGAPLSTSDGHRVGTLCIIDDRERELSRDQLERLRDLADCVQEELGKAETETLLAAVARAESELRHTQARLDRAVAGTSDGLWDWNVTTGEVWYAPRFKELLGYRGDEFPHVLDSFASHLHPEDAEATWAAVNTHLEERAPYDVEYRLRTRSGDYRWFQARGQGAWDEAGKPVLMSGSIMDVTRRKEAERALVKAKEQAEEGNRMKSEFLNMMSHELRTPLTVVLGYLPLLKNAATMPPPEMIAEMVTDMRQAGDHLLHLINDLLDLSKIEAGKVELKREQLALSDVVDEVLQELRHEAEAKRVSLLNRVEETGILGDRRRLRQIFINLVGNAIKFTERGTITVSSRPLDGGVELEVADTGIGIPEHELPAIFDRFRQVDSSSTRKAGGTGLGLAITRKLVQLHGGTIGVTSQPGVGSRFTFSLMENPGD